MAELNGIIFDDDQTVWVDEFDHSPVGQSEETDIHGGLVVEWISPNADGRPVTLDLGWIEKSVLDQIITLRDAETQTIIPLMLPDGRTMDVLFRRSDGNPVEAVPVVTRTEYQDNDLFHVIVSLMQVQ